jgi:hypothetical protein
MDTFPLETLADFETLDIADANGVAVAVPIVVAFVAGQPAPVIGATIASACDHHGATWSSDFDMRCPFCGVRLFLPPRLLAHLPEQWIEQMDALWHAAGCPPWYGDHWGITPGYWTILPVRQFAMTGGLPALNERVAQIRADVTDVLAQLTVGAF